jgi:hypothetical protein
MHIHPFRLCESASSHPAPAQTLPRLKPRHYYPFYHFKDILMLRCIGHTLLWIIPLVTFGLWITFFDVFPEHYHRLVALGYVASWVVAVWRIARCMYATGADEGAEGYRQASHRSH